jgi:hypothetical protein
MAKYDTEPWPSTYEMGEEVSPTKLVPNIQGREVGAFRSAIPPHTTEPPQIHLIAARDGKPFQELITNQDRKLLVAYFDPRTRGYRTEEHTPGRDLIIPSFKIHWLINPNDTRLNFTCEYAPSPWDGDNDEPEFPNLSALMAFVESEGLMQQLMDA